MSAPHSVRRAAVAYVVLGAVLAVVIAIVLFLVGLGPVWAVLAGVVVGAGFAVMVHLRADAAALRALGARPASPGELPQLENLVEGLVVANGFRMPVLYIVDDAAPNAAAVGRTPRHSGIVVTSGLLQRLRRIELEGVLAHELSRIRARETLLAVTTAQLAGRFLGFSKALSTRVAAHLVEPTASVRADLAGIALTRYPPGLSSALQSMRADGRALRVDPPAYRHLWMNVPDGALARQDFSLEDRIDVLQEL